MSDYVTFCLVLLHSILVLHKVVCCHYTTILYNNISLVKYADDTVIIGLIINNDIVNYQKQVSDVVSWCTSHSLILNVKKTKELIFDFSKSTPYHEPLTIQGCDV